MVEKFKTIVEKIRQEKGELNLFALMKMDEIADKWTVILSAPWSQEGNADNFKYILDTIKSNLTTEEVSTIARVAIYPKTNHLIDLLLKFNAGASIVNQPINGNQIHEGYVIISNPSLNESIRQSALM